MYTPHINVSQTIKKSKPLDFLRTGLADSVVKRTSVFQLAYPQRDKQINDSDLIYRLEQSVYYSIRWQCYCISHVYVILYFGDSVCGLMQRKRLCPDASVFPLEIQLPRGQHWDPINLFSMCTCAKPEPRFPFLFVIILFVFSDLSGGLVVRFVDIG